MRLKTQQILRSEKIVRFSSFKKYSASCLRQLGRGFEDEKWFLQNHFSSSNSSFLNTNKFLQNLLSFQLTMVFLRNNCRITGHIINMDLMLDVYLSDWIYFPLYPKSLLNDADWRVAWVLDLRFRFVLLAFFRMKFNNLATVK